jgi:hypothetical protein
MPGSYSARFVRGPDAITLADLLPGTQSAITSLTHSALGGSADNTLADMTATYNEAVAEANLKDLAAKVNEILVVLRTYGMIAT